MKRKSRTRWTAGNRAELLENGEAYYPAVFEAIRNAQHEVIVETFILLEDKVGLALQAALLQAARNGACVDVMVDGFGSCDLTAEFIGTLAAAGIRVRTFDPYSRIFGVRINVLRRMHRKIVVVDGRQAFIGGINFSADHLADFGPQAKQDYAVRLRGPIVDDIRRFGLSAIGERNRAPLPPPPERTAAGAAAHGVEALLVTRDNVDHLNDIERHYRAALRTAQRSVLIANAYFFPGYRLLREMRRAARRGVDVRLILQGEPDMPIVKTAAALLYEHLHSAGIRIHEYCRRPLHGKVAVVDDDWATVGSSNLDPLSLSLNLEANVVLRDPAFAARLRGRLEQLIANECEQVVPAPHAYSGWRWWGQLRTSIVFHFLRRFPGWVSRLPRHTPELQTHHRAHATGERGAQ